MKNRNDSFPRRGDFIQHEGTHVCVTLVASEAVFGDLIASQHQFNRASYLCRLLQMCEERHLIKHVKLSSHLLNEIPQKNRGALFTEIGRLPSIQKLSLVNIGVETEWRRPRRPLKMRHYKRMLSSKSRLAPHIFSASDLINLIDKLKPRLNELIFSSVWIVADTPALIDSCRGLIRLKTFRASGSNAVLWWAKDAGKPTIPGLDRDENRDENPGEDILLQVYQSVLSLPSLESFQYHGSSTLCLFHSMCRRGDTDNILEAMARAMSHSTALKHVDFVQGLHPYNKHIEDVALALVSPISPRKQSRLGELVSRSRSIEVLPSSWSLVSLKLELEVRNESAFSLAIAVSSNSPTLTRLAIHGEFSAVTLRTFAFAIGFNQTLQHLSLFPESIPFDESTIDSFVESLENNRTLESLHLNPVTDGAQAHAKFLQLIKTKNHTLQEIGKFGKEDVDPEMRRKMELLLDLGKYNLRRYVIGRWDNNGNQVDPAVFQRDLMSLSASLTESMLLEKLFAVFTLNAELVQLISPH